MDVNPYQVSDNELDGIDENEKLRHSCAHVLAMAILELFPKAKLGIGPAIKDGFYYDFDINRPVTKEDIEKLEEKMIEIKKMELKFVQEIIPKEQAIDMLNIQGQLYKVELANELTDKEISFYKVSDRFKDMCRGPHVEHTGLIGEFRLTKSSAAHWRGDSSRPQLQRVYGVAFKTEEELDNYFKIQEELSKRDYRVIGKDLQLYYFDNDRGTGLPIWLPKGNFIVKSIKKYVSNKLIENGYQEVTTPQIINTKVLSELKILPFIKDLLYPEVEVENEKFSLRPSTIYQHMSVFSSVARSYRELPLKFSEFGNIYTNTKSGMLSGIRKTREYHSTDINSYVTQDQVQDELRAMIELSRETIRELGFTNFSYRMSIHDDLHQERYHADEPMWEQTENLMREVIESMKLSYSEIIGDTVYFGPKFEIIVKDEFDREEALASFYIDMYLPKVFSLEYKGEDGETYVPTALHGSIIGSFERFFSLYIEQNEGNFPVWLAPIQLVIIPISKIHNEYANELLEQFTKSEIRAVADGREEKMQGKIRDAQLQKIPYMLVIGDKEADNRAVSVRLRDGRDLGMMSSEELIEKIKGEEMNKK